MVQGIGGQLDGQGLEQPITHSIPGDQKHTSENKSTPKCEMTFKAWSFPTTTWLKECLVAGSLVAQLQNAEALLHLFSLLRGAFLHN